MTLSLDEFVQQDIERSGRTAYTMADVARLVEQWREITKVIEAAEREIDALLVGTPEQEAQP